MEMRVEQLSVRTGLSVDTIRYYQSKGLLDPPRRQGRVAWYDDRHLERLDRVRSLQQRGFTLATIVRLVNGDLDAADEALLAELTGANGDPGRSRRSDPSTAEDDGAVAEAGSREHREETFTIAELAAETGVPLALLKAIEAEGLLIPRRFGDHERYTTEDVATARAGLLLLEWGIPLSALLALARRHHEATQAVAEEAVSLFSTHVRSPLRQGRTRTTGTDGGPPDAGDAGDVGDVGRLVEAYADLLPAVNTLVANHFTRTLVNTALDHVEQVGSAAERQAIRARINGGSAGGAAGPGQAAAVPLP
jgi:DNA-binding transcriptional MerR regulator